MRIFFIDEDHAKFRHWTIELEFMGMEVIPIGDADRAYETVTEQMTSDDWALIDVMLSPRTDGETRFPAVRNPDNLNTGLRLLEDLVERRPDLFPSRASLITNTVNDDVWDEACGIAESMKVALLEKPELASADEFAKRLLAEIDA